jgi:hypothetical protein
MMISGISRRAYSIGRKLNLLLVDLQWRQRMQAMQSPKVSEWVKYAESENEYESDDWTEECQGVAQDGTNWYFSSNKAGMRSIYRFSVSMKKQNIS